MKRFNHILAACLVWALASVTQAADMPTDELELGYGHETLDNNYRNWSDLYLEAVHRFGPRQTVYGGLRQTQRFDLNDQELSAGYYYPLSDDWTALIEASASPSHHVLARYSAFAQLQKNLGDGWNAAAGLRRNQYATTSSSLVILTGERYWGDFRAAYKLYLATLQGAGTTSSHNGQLSYYLSDRNSLTLSITQGSQLDNLGTLLGLQRYDVNNVSLYGRYWLNQAWGVSYELLSERQGSFFTRKGIRLGLRHAF